MRALTLAVVLVAGCTGGAGGPEASPPPGSAVVEVASATPRAASSITPSPAPPTSLPVADTVYTAADEEIATFIKTGASQAIPRLQHLNVTDPGTLKDLFVPLGTWIARQLTGVEAFSPSGCTADAVAKFIEGMDAYDEIREEFLAWKDWGAHGHAFHPEAPRQAAALLEQAVVELDAHCSS
jgi:hypothetical protein